MSGKAVQTLDLSELWIKDRFIRTVTTAASDQEKLAAFTTLAKSLKKIKTAKSQKNTITISAGSVDEITDAKNEFLKPAYGTSSEITLFLSGKTPTRTVVQSTTQEADDYLTKLNNQFSTQFGISAENIEQLSSTKNNPDILTFINGKISSINFTKIVLRNIGDTILTSFPIDIPSPSAKRFIELLLSSYFKFIPDSKINDIIFTQLLSPEVTDILGRFKLISQNVGPQFHKLFQVVAPDPRIKPELRQVFKSFVDSLPAASTEAVRDMLSSSKFEEFEVLEIDFKPVNVGSMAQFHRATVKYFHNGKVDQIGLRILKPGVTEWLDIDNAFLEHMLTLISEDSVLRAQTEGVDYSQFIKDLILLVKEELDFKRTVEFENKAFLALSTIEPITNESGLKINVRVPKAYMSSNQNVMATEWAYGDSFEKYFEAEPSSARTVAETLFSEWLKSSILASGLLHADLHAGNIKIEKTMNPNEINLNVLDYGMTGQLTPENQKLFILLAAAAAANNTRLIARALWDQSSIRPSISFDEFESLIASKEASLKDAHSRTQFEKAVLLATKIGFSFDANFIKLIRGYAAAKSLLVFTKSEKNISEIILKIFKQNPQYVAKSISSLAFVSKDDVLAIGKSLGASVQDYFNSGKASADVKDAAKKVGGFLGRFAKNLGQVVLESAADALNEAAKNANAPARHAGNTGAQSSPPEHNNDVVSQKSIFSHSNTSQCLGFYNKK